VLLLIRKAFRHHLEDLQFSCRKVGKRDARSGSPQVSPRSRNSISNAGHLSVTDYSGPEAYSRKRETAMHDGTHSVVDLADDMDGVGVILDPFQAGVGLRCYPD
jgi:hypothetical protein